MPPTTETVFAGYPDAFVYDAPDAKAAKVAHLLWGDWMRLEGESQNGFERVTVRGSQARGRPEWIKKKSIQRDPLLEITFVDVGQGDGCVVSAPRPDGTPGNRFRHVLVDAGQFDNMRRYLGWRFNIGAKGRDGAPRAQHFDCAVLTHPDEDHYNGFSDLFDDPNVSFGAVLHNGIVERVSGLGEKKVNGSTYVEPVITTAALEELLAKKSEIKGKQYPRLLQRALSRCQDVRALTAGDFLPGFEKSQPISIEVLGPVPSQVGGARLLRSFGDAGKTKNGHSVVLRLTYGKLSVLLGGDLNVPAEEHLLSHYGQGLTGAQREEELRRRLGADIAKACHHGSADFSAEFLKVVNPLATVISSGDDEPHAHPRADALGGIGRACSRARSLIFCTEVSRSAKEMIKHPNVLRAQYQKLFDEFEGAKNQAGRATLRKKIDDRLAKDLERSIAVYGAINLRTDGERVVMAYRLERKRGSTRWDLYQMERDAKGELVYVPKPKD